MGVGRKNAPMSQEEIKKIESFYKDGFINGDGRLDRLAEEMGRSKNLICRFAGQMDLTMLSRKSTKDIGQGISERAKLRIKKNGHPRGALGMKHSEEMKEAAKIRAKKNWEKMTDEQKMVRTLKQAKTAFKNGSYVRPRHKTTWKSGWREIGGIRKFYRSRWEANYARYLEWLRSLGEIKRWEHEPEIFWFEGVKRGSVSYLPDFRVTNNSDSIEYHEVKGWMDSRSKTKIRRMAKYHPDVKLLIIAKKEYNGIKRSVQSLIPGWEE